MNRGRRIVSLVAAVVCGIGMTFVSVVVVAQLGGVPQAASEARRAETPAPVELVPPPPSALPMPTPEPVPAPSTSVPRPDAGRPLEHAAPSLRAASQIAGLASLPAATSSLSLPALGVPSLGLGLGSGAGAANGGGDGREVESAGTPRPARLMHRAAPVYPAAARRQGIEGHVLLRVRVNARGGVEDVVVVASEPPGVFEEAALAAARRYQFAPAQRGARSVATTVEQRVVFRLRR